MAVSVTIPTTSAPRKSLLEQRESDAHAMSVAADEAIKLETDRLPIMAKALNDAQCASAEYAYQRAVAEATGKVVASITAELQERPCMEEEHLFLSSVMQQKLEAVVQREDAAANEFRRCRKQFATDRQAYVLSVDSANKHRIAKAKTWRDYDRIKAAIADDDDDACAEAKPERVEENPTLIEECYGDENGHLAALDDNLHIASAAHNMLGLNINFIEESEQKLMDAVAAFKAELKPLHDRAKNCTDNLHSAETAEATRLDNRAEIAADLESYKKSRNTAKHNRTFNENRCISHENHICRLTQNAGSVINNFLGEMRPDESSEAQVRNEDDYAGMLQRASNTIDAARLRMEKTSAAVATLRYIDIVYTGPTTEPVAGLTHNYTNDELDNLIQQDFDQRVNRALRMCTDFIDPIVNTDTISVDESEEPGDEAATPPQFPHESAFVHPSTPPHPSRSRSYDAPTSTPQSAHVSPPWSPSICFADGGCGEEATPPEEATSPAKRQCLSAMEPQQLFC